MGEEPLIGLVPGGLSRTNQESQVAAARQGMQVFQADPRESGDFLLGKNLLARLDGHSGNTSQSLLVAFFRALPHSSHYLRCCRNDKGRLKLPAIVVPFCMGKRAS